MEFVRKAIALSHTFIILIVVAIAFTCHNEWQEVEALEVGNRHIDEFRKEVNRIHIQLIEFSLLGETALDWDETDLENYHAQRIALDSTLCLFNETHVIGRIDSVRSLLEDKERQMFQIVRLIDEQQSINKKIASQVPLIVQTSMQEQPKKPKRKGFLGIFGKKEETKPPTTTTTLRSPNRSMVSEQKEQSRRLSEQADSLAARNADLNRQLKGLICQIENKVQADLQGREDEIVAMRGKSFMQVGGLMGFVLLLLLISYIIIHRDAKSIKQYKRKTTDLIGQLEQSVQRNEALIASRKKAVHTITHELRTPLTAITGYTELLQKECSKENNVNFLQSIQQSSDRMRDMLNTLLDFFRLDNGKEQPKLLPCRISTITHTLETEFMPVAMNKGLSLTVKNGNDAVVLTDKERIIQIGNNLLSNAIWKIQCKLPPKTKRFCPLKTFNNAPLKSLDRWGYYYFSLFPSVCSHFTDTFSCQLNPVRRMYNTIHNGICYCRVSDCIIPIVRWQLRGDDDGLAPMSVLYYIEQDGSFLGIKVHKEEVIQYEQRAPFDSLEFRFQCAFYFCHLKRTHKFRSIRIICPYALLAGFIPHCCGKEALPGTG